MWIKPGPAQLLKIATTLDKGLLFGIAFSFGSITMCSIFFVMAALGYKVLSDIFAYTGFILQIFGAAYLTYLGVRGLLKIYNGSNKSNLKTAAEAVNQKAGLLGSYTLGFLAALTSPFWIFYFIGILPSLVDLSGLNISNFIFGAFLVFASGVMVDIPFLTLVSQMQRAFTNSKVTKYINVFINFAFLVIAAFLLYSAFFGQNMSFDINDVL